jgi:hypothetical protein
MKALELLYADKKWIEQCEIHKLPIERVNIIVKDLVDINEAIAELEEYREFSESIRMLSDDRGGRIAELEALQQPKNCEGCKHNDTRLGMCDYGYACIRMLMATISDGYEPKEKA